MEMKRSKTNKKSGIIVSQSSELPQELLEDIAKQLETRADIYNFRAVSKSWLRSAPLSLLHPPKHLLNPLFPIRFKFSSGCGSRAVVAAAYTVCRIRPLADLTQPPWLIVVEEFNQVKLFLRKPLSRTAYSSLPDNFPRVLDSSKLHVSQIYTGYCFRNGDQRDMFSDNMWSEYMVKKAVLVVDPASRFRSPSIDDCVLALLNHTHEMWGLNLGRRAKLDYVTYLPVRDSLIDDIVSFKGELYAVDRRGMLTAINYHDGKIFVRKKWLVESSGILYLVQKWSEGYQNAVKVYKLDDEQGCWNQVQSLGDDRILFVTFDGCFFVSVCDFPGWKGNCIVFYVGSLPCYRSQARGPDQYPFDIAVYELNKEGYLNYPSDGPYPRPSLRYWQPPEWLSPDLCS